MRAREIAPDIPHSELRQSAGEPLSSHWPLLVIGFQQQRSLCARHVALRCVPFGPLLSLNPLQGSGANQQLPFFSIVAHGVAGTSVGTPDASSVTYARES